MQIDVGAYIADLLFEHDSVSVPGLGSFSTTYQSASIDPVQGKLHPPGKELDFNSNLTVDDGLLIQYVKEKHQLSYSDARQAVEEYVQKVQEVINRREIVVFPKVGRLYKDFEQKLQFLPETTNFNLDSFGLPTIQFYPVTQSSSGEARRPAPAVPAKTGRSVSLSGVLAEWFQRYLPYIGVLSVLIIAVSFFFYLREQQRASSPDNAGSRDIPTSRLNRKPTEGASAGQEPAGDNTAGPEEGEIDTEAITPAPDQKSAYIAIGLFSDEANIKRLIERIYEAGYEPFTEDIRGLKRVGVQIAYQNEGEVENALEDVRNRFDTKAFVLRRE